MTVELGRVGLWTASQQWPSDIAEISTIALEVESMGFATVWLGNAAGDLALAEAILDSNARLTVATGIVNIWTSEPSLVTTSWQRILAKHPKRFLLGLGAGHAPHVEAAGRRYSRPVAAMLEYLDEMDAAPAGCPPSKRILGALGPRMLGIAAQRAVGAHPYLVTPSYTGQAREAIGPAGQLAVHQMVAPTDEPERARTLGRRILSLPLRLDHYRKNFARMGFAEADFVNGGSDRLIDGLIAWGNPADIVRRVDAHLRAGATHVAVQILAGPTGFALPRASDLVTKSIAERLCRA